MTHKATTHSWWTFAITSVALFMVTLDNLVVTTALPVIRDDLARGAREPRVDGERVHAHLRRAAADRRGARRPLRPPAHVRDRARHLHRSPRRPRRSRRRSARSTPRARVQGVGGAIVMPLTLTILSAGRPARSGAALALGAWGGIGGLAVALGPLVGGAVVSGISWHWIFWLNVPIGLVLLPLALLRLDGDARPGGAARPAAASRSPAPACSASSGASSAATASAGRAPEIVGALVGGAVLVGAFVAWELRTRGADAADALLPQPRVRARERRVAAACSSGCSARSSCSRSSSRPCRATRRSSSGLRILPWTAMPMFVAPIAGALLRPHRRRGRSWAPASRCRRSASRWLAAVSTPTSPYVELVAAVHRSRASAWRSSSRRSRTSSSASVRPEEEGQASGANNAIRELGGVFGVAVLASVFAHYGGYASGQAFVDGMTPAVWVGAAVVGLGAIAAFAIKRRPVRQRSRGRGWTDATRRVPGTVPGTRLFAHTRAVRYAALLRGMGSEVRR